MVKNNIEIDVKVKCIEGGITQAQLAENVETTSQYVNRIGVNNLEKYLLKTVTEIVPGGARGVDMSAKEYALSHGIKLT